MVVGGERDKPGGGMVSIAVDATSILQVGCELASIDECPPTTRTLRSVIQ
jgi:hypothetical protein